MEMELPPKLTQNPKKVNVEWHDVDNALTIPVEGSSD